MSLDCVLRLPQHVGTLQHVTRRLARCNIGSNALEPKADFLRHSKVIGASLSSAFKLVLSQMTLSICRTALKFTAEQKTTPR